MDDPSSGRVNTHPEVSTEDNFASFVERSKERELAFTEEKLINAQQKRVNSGMMMFMTEGEKDDILTNPLIDNTENSDDDSDDDDQELKKDVRKQAQRAVTNPAMLSSD